MKPSKTHKGLVELTEFEFDKLCLENVKNGSVKPDAYEKLYTELEFYKTHNAIIRYYLNPVDATIRYVIEEKRSIGYYDTARRTAKR